MPNAPMIFGHAHGEVVEGSAIPPVLSDAGIMARFAQPFASEWTLDISGYVAQGPRLVSEDEETSDYVQGSRRFGSWEGILRWAQTLDAQIEGASVLDGQEALGLGFDSWFTGTVPLKVMYEIVPDFDDRVIVQWAFGFGERGNRA